MDLTKEIDDAMVNSLGSNRKEYLMRKFKASLPDVEYIPPPRRTVTTHSQGSQKKRKRCDDAQETEEDRSRELSEEYAL